eukprot:scaffold18875_cov22-Cyclotella_meneghiniana.AAC.2
MNSDEFGLNAEQNVVWSETPENHLSTMCDVALNIVGKISPVGNSPRFPHASFHSHKPNNGRSNDIEILMFKESKMKLRNSVSSPSPTLQGKAKRLHDENTPLSIQNQEDNVQSPSDDDDDEWKPPQKSRRITFSPSSESDADADIVQDKCVTTIKDDKSKRRARIVLPNDFFEKQSKKMNSNSFFNTPSLDRNTMRPSLELVTAVELSKVRSNLSSCEAKDMSYEYWDYVLACKRGFQNLSCYPGKTREEKKYHRVIDHYLNRENWRAPYKNERWCLPIFEVSVDGRGVICTNCKRMVVCQYRNRMEAKLLASHAKQCVVGNFYDLRKDERMKEFETMMSWLRPENEEAWRKGKLLAFSGSAQISLAEMYKRNDSRPIECRWNREEIIDYHSAITADQGMTQLYDWFRSLGRREKNLYPGDVIISRLVSLGVPRKLIGWDSNTKSFTGKGVLLSNTADGVKERTRLFALKLLDEGLATPCPSLQRNLARLYITSAGKTELTRLGIELPIGECWTQLQYLPFAKKLGLGFRHQVLQAMIKIFFEEYNRRCTAKEKVPYPIEDNH